MGFALHGRSQFAAFIACAAGLAGSAAGQHLPLVPLERTARSLSVAADPAAIAQLRPLTGARMDLPLADGRIISVDLERFDVMPEGVTPIAATLTPKGVDTRPLAGEVQLWRGVIDGNADSRVYLGIAPGAVQGFIDTGDSLHYIATPPGSAVTLISAREDFDPANRVDFICDGALIPPGMDIQIAEPSGGITSRGVNCRVYEIAMDADVEFGELFPSTQAAANYVQILMGAVTEIYRNELDAVLLSPFIRIWEDNDPWTAGNTSDQLGEFRSYWRANMGGQPRTLAHLVSGRGLGGGVAWLSQACSTNYGYAVSANMRGTFPYPILDNNSGNWDLMVVAHELGHNFGTSHTHNINAYNPVIDGCGSSPQDCSVAAAGEGTIMSYCHLCSGGIRNMKMRFGDRVSATVRNYMNGPAANCGTQQSAPVLNTQPEAIINLCPGQNLRVEVSATGNSLRYQWFRNTVLIPGATARFYEVPQAQLAASGIYSCRVSNDCGEVLSQNSTVIVFSSPACQPCPADWDRSGGVDGDDITAFFSAWQSGNADIDLSGGTDGDDISFFFSRWQSGC